MQHMPSANLHLRTIRLRRLIVGTTIAVIIGAMSEKFALVSLPLQDLINIARTFYVNVERKKKKTNGRKRK